MKPEHFLYKSDGLYYIPNMPDSSKYYSTETYPYDTFDQDSYKEALERAKEEASKCNIKLEVKAVANAMVQGVTKSEKDWIEGEIYTINIEEKIEVVEEDTVEDGGGCYVAGSRRFARIAAPKKEEESIIWNEWLSKVVDGEGYIISTKFREAQKQFEIKRKPL